MTPLPCVERATDKPLTKSDYFTSLYANYWTHVRGFLFKRIHGSVIDVPAAVDDLTEETFLKAWKGLREWPLAHERTWLFLVAAHTHIDWLQREQCRVKAERTARLGPAGFGTEADPAESLCRREEAAAAWRHLASLRTSHQQGASGRDLDVLKAYALAKATGDGQLNGRTHDYEALAARRGVSASAIKSQLYRARQMVRATYQTTTAEAST